MLDRAGDGKARARGKLTELGLMTIQNINQAVETLSGGQRQGVAVARAAAFGSQGGDHGRADGRARRQGIAPRAGADPRREARGLPIVLISTTCRMCSRSPTASTSTGSAAAMRGRSEVDLDVGCGGLHDRRKKPPEEALAA
jgi:hypothetical protein